jgi:hypothetical protein
MPGMRTRVQGVLRVVTPNDKAETSERSEV